MANSELATLASAVDLVEFSLLHLCSMGAVEEDAGSSLSYRDFKGLARPSLLDQLLAGLSQPFIARVLLNCCGCGLSSRSR